MAGFTFSHLQNGGNAPTIREMVIADGEVLSKGELVNLESGELDAAATGDTALVGAVLADVDNTADGLTAKVIVDEDAVYAVVDANARLAGATLDIGSGGLTVAASSNADLIVVKTCTDAEPTLVAFNNTHFMD
jgi:hypothetical protein